MLYNDTMIQINVKIFFSKLIQMKNYIFPKSSSAFAPKFVLKGHIFFSRKNKKNFKTHKIMNFFNDNTFPQILQRQKVLSPYFSHNCYAIHQTDFNKKFIFFNQIKNIRI